MVKNFFYFLILIFSFSCSTIKKSSFDPSKKFSPIELKQDFLILDNVLKSNHPSLYWYTPKDSIDNYFAETYRSLKDSLTEQQFRRKISWAISKIHCGHTSVRYSKAYAKYFIKQKTELFPFQLKVWKDSAIVISNLAKGDSVIKRGTPITAINHIPVKDIIDSMCELISSDGYSNIFKYQVISFNFPAFYKNTFGLDSSYNVRYIDSKGKQIEKIYKNFEGTVAFLNTKQPLLPQETTRKKIRKANLIADRNIEIDTSLKTALVSVNTFSKGKLIRFFRRSFTNIKKRNIKNIILDLRLNSGGSIFACTRLSQYLVDKSFHVADTVAAYTRSFPYKSYVKPWFIYWLSMHISGRRYEDGRIHFRYFEKHYFKPKKKKHFNGNIYLLTGGYTFSAATIVAGSLKGQSNVKIIGEETGGGGYGNSAMLLTTIVLPHTGVRVSLPLYRMVLNANRVKNGRGISPDIQVAPSSKYIKNNVDAKLQKALDVIRENESQ